MAKEPVPDVLGYKLVLAEKALEEAGWEWTIEETVPYKRREGFVRRQEDAYVLRQTLTPDNKLVLLVGYKVGKEV